MLSIPYTRVEGLTPRLDSIRLQVGHTKSYVQVLVPDLDSGRLMGTSVRMRITHATRWHVAGDYLGAWEEEQPGASAHPFPPLKSEGWMERGALARHCPCPPNAPGFFAGRRRFRAPSSPHPPRPRGRREGVGDGDCDSRDPRLPSAAARARPQVDASPTSCGPSSSTLYQRVLCASDTCIAAALLRARSRRTSAAECALAAAAAASVAGLAMAAWRLYASPR